MPLKYHHTIVGLTDDQVIASREKHGSNKLFYRRENRLIDRVKNIVKDPMILLLFVAVAIYFIGGQIGDAFFLCGAILLVAFISIYQDSRSRNALEQLKDISQARCKVIRNNRETEIKSEDLVVGDSLIVEEGTMVEADGVIIQSNDFSVNESILTGESLPAFKDKDKEDHYAYKGTTVASGLAIITITAIGNKTKLGIIGESLQSIAEEKSPLELKISRFVKQMAFSGLVIFLIIWGINYSKSSDILFSLLQSLTLVMSILPEEIPVAFTTFMALGAWRLMRNGVVVKQMKTVETLGGATVICTDKTGTITENRMSLAGLFARSSGKINKDVTKLNEAELELLTIAMWASEPVPFDPMEKALHDTYSHVSATDNRPLFHMVHEYPLGGKPPMMTHIFEDAAGQQIIAAKGAPEAIIAVSALNATQKEQVLGAITAFTGDGFRVLGVAQAIFWGSDFPSNQQDFRFDFKGIVAFYDPPKNNIKKVLNDFYNAGIVVKIITGDNAATTMAIAKQIDFKGSDTYVNGDALMQLTDGDLIEKVKHTNLFTRMFPEAKLRVVNALKASSEVVAMTGDGVNDGPALKAAHIGIAMGKKGTEIARQAASLILMEDDLSKMTDAVAAGRKIYTNLKKAIRYILSIHIPIILTVFIPLVLNWAYPNLFSPVHVIFLELIMGPTCSIIYENDPMEPGTMSQKPRPLGSNFFSFRELASSIVQGLIIALASLLVYQYAVRNDFDENTTRSMVFLVLIVANILLTLINRSFLHSMYATMRYHNNLVPLIIGISSGLTFLLFYIKPLATFFGFEALRLQEFGISTCAGILSVIWYEVVKWRKRKLSFSIPTTRIKA